MKEKGILKAGFLKIFRLFKYFRQFFFDFGHIYVKGDCS